MARVLSFIFALLCLQGSVFSLDATEAKHLKRNCCIVYLNGSSPEPVHKALNALFDLSGFSSTELSISRKGKLIYPKGEYKKYIFLIDATNDLATEQYTRLLASLPHNPYLLVPYEDLIGPAGGEDLLKQRDMLSKIAAFCGEEKTLEELNTAVCLMNETPYVHPYNPQFVGQEPAPLLYLSGMSKVGKSSVAKALIAKIPGSLYLDENVFREVFGNNELAQQKLLMTAQQARFHVHLVIVKSTASKAKERKAIKTGAEKAQMPFFHVFLNRMVFDVASVEEEPYEFPRDADLFIQAKDKTPEECADEILALLP